MNLYRTAQLLWREKLIVGACAIVAVVVAILATFQISLSPPNLHPRRFQMGVAGLTVLVSQGGARTLGSAQGPHALAGVAGSYAALTDTAPVIDPIAHALHVAPDNVGVQVQITQQVPLSQSQPLEPQVGTEILATRKHFYLVARNVSGTQEVNLYAQAPTRAQADTMVTSAARAMRRFAARSAQLTHQRGPNAIKVQMIGGRSGGTLDRGVSRDAAILIGALAWIVLVVGVLTLKSQRDASRRGWDRVQSAQA